MQPAAPLSLPQFDAAALPPWKLTYPVVLTVGGVYALVERGSELRAFCTTPRLLIISEANEASQLNAT
jgi:hypothetical protein